VLSMLGISFYHLHEEFRSALCIDAASEGIRPSKSLMHGGCEPLQSLFFLSLLRRSAGEKVGYAWKTTGMCHDL